MIGLIASIPRHEEPVVGQVRRAELLASEIEAEIEALGWPLGHVLGSEAELCARYGVGRSVLREAVRLLEHHRVARMRAGRNGGLTVIEPDATPIVSVAALLLRRAGVEPRHLLEVRRALETTTVRLAAERLTETGVQRLRAAMDAAEAAPASELRVHAGDFHQLIASLTANPVLMLFTDIVTRLTRERVEGPSSVAETRHEVLHAHRAIAEAVIAGDAGLAQHRMNRHFDAIAEAWGDGEGSPRS